MFDGRICIFLSGKILQFNCFTVVLVFYPLQQAEKLRHPCVCIEFLSKVFNDKNNKCGYPKRAYAKYKTNGKLKQYNANGT